MKKSLYVASLYVVQPAAVRCGPPECNLCKGTCEGKTCIIDKIDTMTMDSFWGKGPEPKAMRGKTLVVETLPQDEIASLTHTSI